MTLECGPVQRLCMTRGEALDITVNVKDENGDPADMQGATATFGLAKNPRREYVLELSASASGDTLTTTITSEQSAELLDGSYYFSAWVTILDEDYLVARGWLTVQPDPRSA